jgi:murein DD-endopeptidase MepM/ murein hydrolase activator NlpD
LRKRFYILFVSRDSEGELRKIHIPLHYLYVFLAGAVLGMLTITGIAGSYTRMAIKVARFNQLRSEKDQLRSRYEQLEQVAREKDIQVASLGSIASEVSSLYGLKSQGFVTDDSGQVDQQQFTASLDELHSLRRAALTGGATLGLSMGSGHRMSTSEWMNLSDAPSLWPVMGRLMSPFGSRSDPFSGEGAFHKGVDISAPYGNRIVAPADGEVSFASFMSGYGRMVAIDHGHGITTRYGHLSAFSVVEGQMVRRGETIGYVGMSGRSTGPHLHYEVWVRHTPVNPYKYLRTTTAQLRHTAR